MKKIELEQGTEQWLSWRKTVITATDASIIMGNNPWETSYKCWQRKLGLIEDKKSNEAMERGKKLEPEARALFIQDFGIDMVPAVVESTEFDFLGASLDGISVLGNNILEIKCGGSKLHEMAAREEIPQYYQDQMQHQLLVTGAERCYYYSFDGTKGICIVVLPDPKFREKFLPKAREFWRCVALNEEPSQEEGDHKDMSIDPRWQNLAEEYSKIDKEIKALEDQKKLCRGELLKLCNDESCRGSGIRITRTMPKGRVDYELIPELVGVNLNKYRKTSSVVWTVRSV